MTRSFFKTQIETTETWVIKRPRSFIRGWCGQCGREVSLLIPEEAARLTCQDLGYFYFLMEQNQFHVFNFGITSQPFICLNSLCSV